MKDVKLLVLFTWVGDNLNTYHRMALAKALVELAKVFEIAKVEYMPELPEWDIRDWREEIQTI